MIEDTSMYDHLPYKRDAERCNIGSVALFSGNVVKYYRCALGETLELNDMDELAIEKIRKYVERENERLASLDTESDVVDSYYDGEYVDSNDLSDEQIAGLLGDKPKKKGFLGNYDDEEF